MFQSTHPRGVRPERYRVTYYRIQFQSTHPRGVRPADHRPAACRRPCFNPRTRVGCDLPAPGHVAHATEFQSTHPRGVRRGRCHLLAGRSSGFNPRTRVGCDPVERCLPQSGHPVSIHAPAWGATRHGPAARRLADGFNPRTRVGCDLRRPALRSGLMTCFNPRTRVGCDITSHMPAIQDSPVSIHAPAWGATVSMFYPVDSRD